MRAPRDLAKIAAPLFTSTPAFRQSRPVLLTTFTNKVGSIGLGAAVAFPLLIHASRLGPFTALMIGVFGLQLAVLWSLRGEIGRLA